MCFGEEDTAEEKLNGLDSVLHSEILGNLMFQRHVLWPHQTIEKGETGTDWQSVRFGISVDSSAATPNPLRHGDQPLLTLFDCFDRKKLLLIIGSSLQTCKAGPSR